MKIGVVGTGVAGSLFAAACRDLPGLDVRAFDRVDFGQRDAAGTGLNIGPNALAALRRHGGQNPLIAALLEVSLPWRRWFIDLTDGTRLIDIDLLELADEPGLRIRWADLYSVLRNASAAVTTYRRVFNAVEEDSQGRLTAVFREPGGEVVREGPFDMLVAADGRYSALRAFTVGAPRPTIPGIGTWRLLVRDAKESPIDDYGQYFQNNARLLSFALPGGDVYVAGSFPLDGDGPMPEAARTAQAQRRLFTPAGSPPSPAVEWMLSMIDLHLGEVNWARTQEIEPLHQALDGRLLLLGDAAHAMFQTLGQGATQSIEDALAAADLLRSGIRDPAELSKAYEARRSARVAFAKRFTQEATDTLLPGVDPVAGALAKAQPPFLSKLRQLYCDVS